MPDKVIIITSNLTGNRFANRYQGSNKVLSSCPGHIDSPSGQVTFQSHLPNGQGIRQVRIPGFFRTQWVCNRYRMDMEQIETGYKNEHGTATEHDLSSAACYVTSGRHFTSAVFTWRKATSAPLRMEYSWSHAGLSLSIYFTGPQ